MSIIKRNYFFSLVISSVLISCGGGENSVTSFVGDTTKTNSINIVSILESDLSDVNGSFGNAIAFSSDGLTIAVAEMGRTVYDLNNNPINNAGAVQIFTKKNSNWTRGQLLVSPISKADHQFGFSLAFSPQGETLAVGMIGASNLKTNGRVYLFTNNNGNWSYNQEVLSESASLRTYNEFGFNISFDPNDTYLAVTERRNNSAFGRGAVQIFKKTNNEWRNPVNLVQVMTAEDPNVALSFGHSHSFNNDGSIFAIAGSVSGSPTTGFVYLYTNLNASWILRKSITSSTATYAYGSNIVFSLDNTHLAISDFGSAENTGRVELYNQNNADWTGNITRGAVLISKTPEAQNFFGSDIAFNFDGTMLAVSEYKTVLNNIKNSGSVQIFDKQADKISWEARHYLSSTSTPPFGSRFGYSIAFSPVENILLIGEVYNTVTPGKISVYEHQ